MKKKCILAAMILLSIGMAACTTGSEESASGSGIVAGTKAANADNGGEDSNDVDNIECTLDAMIVESYENDIIAVRDQDTGIVIWFSTKDAEVIEGDSPIAAGDLVGLTYRGVQGDEEQPGTAVRVVPESMMYN